MVVVGLVLGMWWGGSGRGWGVGRRLVRWSFGVVGWGVGGGGGGGWWGGGGAVGEVEFWRGWLGGLGSFDFPSDGVRPGVKSFRGVGWGVWCGEGFVCGVWGLA